MIIQLKAGVKVLGIWLSKLTYAENLVSIQVSLDYLCPITAVYSNFEKNFRQLIPLAVLYLLPPDSSFLRNLRRAVDDATAFFDGYNLLNNLSHQVALPHSFLPPYGSKQSMGFSSNNWAMAFEAN